MELTKKIVVPHVHPFSGQRSHALEQDLGQFLSFPDPLPDELLLLFEWPPTVRAYNVRVEVEVGEARAAFTDGVEAAKQLFAAFNVQPVQWPTCLRPSREGPPNRFRAAAVTPANAVLRLSVTIDTNRRELRPLSELFTAMAAARRRLPPADARRKAAEESANKAYMAAFPPVHLHAFRRRPAKMTAQDLGAERRGVIWIVPEPLTPLAGYQGYVAIDLGNTGSTLAYMPERAEEVGAIQLLKLDPIYDKETSPTAIQVIKYAPAKPEDQGAMPEAEWRVGDAALTGTEGALILGSKRLLSDPLRREDHRVWLNGTQQTIKKEAPAELFLTRLVERFHAVQDPPRQIHGAPAPPPGADPAADPAAAPDEAGFTSGLAVTCPTTFSEREIDNLRRAVFTGWRRALGETHYKFAPEDIDRVIRLVIDEASAAAMFYLYRDFLRGPGVARSIPYLYPRGVNVLVYDCGGGTTDIALVHASAVYNDGLDRVSRLDIDVIGRTGHRAFGGDNITAAVFALVKAKMAALLSPTPRAPKLELPTDPAKLEGWIKANADVVDQILPTRFRRAELGQQAVRERAAAVLELWQKAEGVKEQLAAKETLDAKLVLPGGDLEKYLAKVYPDRQPARLRGTLAAVKVARAEVDALVVDRVRQTIHRTNGLIRRRLRPADRPTEAEAASLSPAAVRAVGGEVHRVYVLGNASLYPLVRKTLEAELDVPFLAGGTDPAGEEMPGRLVFEKENLKGAVAKGAAAALQMKNEYLGVVVQFDNNLTRRLPFDIWYGDLGRNEQRLYREGQLYDTLEPKLVVAPDRTDGQPGPDAGHVVSLKRQWPDDPRPTPYLTFRFPQEVVGPLLIEHVPATEDCPPFFQMTDQGAGGGPVTGEEEPEAQYVSPPQSGTL